MQLTGVSLHLAQSNVFEYTPPYKTFGDLSLNLLLINLTVSKSSFDFGIIPVPIAQTGSYAMKIFDLFCTLSKPILICFDKIDCVFFFFFFT